MNFDLIYFIKRINVIVRYLPLTLAIALGAMVMGLAIGFCIAIIIEGEKKILKNILGVYVSFFRGTPLMVQLFIFYFGLPQLIPELSKIEAVYMAVFVMSLNASAYLSETIRASINSVNRSQIEAGLSIGMSSGQVMRRIIIPQAARIALPPMSNTFISLIQGTSITFVLGVKDIMASAKVGAAASFKLFENFLAVGLIYWVIVLIISKGSGLLEKRLNRAFSRTR